MSNQNPERLVPLAERERQLAAARAKGAADAARRAQEAAQKAKISQATPISTTPNVSQQQSGSTDLNTGAPIQLPIKSREDTELDSIPESKEQARRSRKAGALATAAVIAAAGLTAGATTGTLHLPANVSRVISSIGNKADTPIPGTVAALGPAGFNDKNCNGPEHAVATLTISGRLPLKWLLMSMDNKQITPAKYMDQVATAMNKPDLKTDSGYPEITANSYQYYMNICQVNNKDGATGSTINTQNLAVTLTPVDASIVVQDKAYMTNLKAGENVTVPPQSFISSNPAYTDASLKAVNDVATYAQGTAFGNQAKGELNLMSDSIVAELAIADPKSPINSIMGHTIYDIEKLAAKMRLGYSNATLSSAMPAPTAVHTLGNEKAANLAPDDPTNPGFVPTAVSVKLGPPIIVTNSPTPTATNGGNS